MTTATEMKIIDLDTLVIFNPKFITRPLVGKVSPLAVK